MRVIKPDVLLADLDLPDAGAWTLILAVRALKPEDGGMVPAVAVGTSPAQGEDARASGFDGFVEQPLGPWNLCRLVATLTMPA